MSVLAAVSSGDLSVLMILIAVLAFAFAVFAALRGMTEAAVALAIIGVIILVVS